MAKILIADTDPDLLGRLSAFFESKRYQVLTAFDSKEALEVVRKEDPQIVLLDVDLPEQNELAVIQAIKRYGPDICVILMSKAGADLVDHLAAIAGADGYITTPFDLADLERLLHWSLKRVFLALDN